MPPKAKIATPEKKRSITESQANDVVTNVLNIREEYVRQQNMRDHRTAGVRLQAIDEQWKEYVATLTEPERNLAYKTEKQWFRQRDIRAENSYDEQMEGCENCDYGCAECYEGN